MDDRNPDQAENSDTDPFRRYVEQVSAYGRAANENAIANDINPERHDGSPVVKTELTVIVKAHSLCAPAYRPLISGTVA